MCRGLGDVHDRHVEQLTRAFAAVFTETGEHHRVEGFLGGRLAWLIGQNEHWDDLLAEHLGIHEEEIPESGAASGSVTRTATQAAINSF